MGPGPFASEPIERACPTTRRERRGAGAARPKVKPGPKRDSRESDPITATALVAGVGDARVFRNGRQFAAWLGLTPQQRSSGGKTSLGQITKRGDSTCAARGCRRHSRWTGSALTSALSSCASIGSQTFNGGESTGNGSGRMATSRCASISTSRRCRSLLIGVTLEAPSW
jgi:hypothetical protein